MIEDVLYGTFIALAWWLILTLVGEPPFMHHHLSDALFWVGVTAACGHWAGRGSLGRRRP